MKLRLSKFQEPAAHLAIIALVAAVAWTFWSPQNSEVPETTPRIHVDSSEALSTWRPSDRRVFLFLSPTCPYCSRSMDFYARLSRVVDSMQRTGDPVALAAVTDSTASRWLQKWNLRTSNVDVDTVLSLPSGFPAPAGVTRVPTVAIHPPEDQYTWAGLQDSTGEQEILSAVRASGASP